MRNPKKLVAGPYLEKNCSRGFGWTREGFAWPKVHVPRLPPLLILVPRGSRSMLNCVYRIHALLGKRIGKRPCQKHWRRSSSSLSAVAPPLLHRSCAARRALPRLRLRLGCTPHTHTHTHTHIHTHMHTQTHTHTHTHTHTRRMTRRLTWPLASTSALAAMSALTASVCPFIAAQCRGVSPCCDGGEEQGVCV